MSDLVKKKLKELVDQLDYYKSVEPTQTNGKLKELAELNRVVTDMDGRYLFYLQELGKIKVVRRTGLTYRNAKVVEILEREM